MYVTEKNIKVADEIVKILINEKCTVAEAQSIMAYVSRDIEESSTVQIQKSYRERFIDASERKE
ncbi:MAG: hypothetical protein HFG14_13990 [Lachnospiraceae bacterium]|jgi:hypothetical protein|nr:hypothetical protein [Lachnospiraceae bacterium]